MKPRFEEYSYEATKLLEKAAAIERRIEKAVEGKDCPDCKGGKLDKAGMCKMGCGGKMAKADMAEKNKYCMKNFGKKYSECSAKEKAQCDKVHAKVEKAEKCPSCGEKMEKGGCMKMGCGGKMAKAQPGFTPEKSKDSVPHFVRETGGQTASQYFSTNQRPLETEDAPKPKNKKGKENVSMEGLGRKLNPHEGTGAEREDASGESKPLKLD